MNDLVIANLPIERREALIRNVIERYLKDEKIADIAKDLGVSKSVLHQALITHAETEWKNGQVCRALTRLNDAEDELDNAKDGFELAKAEKKIKSAQWQLEHVFRRVYGEDGLGPLVPIHIHIGIDRPEQER